MRMKTLNKIYKTACLAGVALFTATSCQDWLTVYPQTQIVEENFWEDKNDLEGVRYAAYKNMCGTLEKLTKWGEIRSDAYEWNNSCSNTGDRDRFKEIREGNLERDSAYNYFEWGSVYTTINYCNKVLQHGEQVLERDKQFTSSEWLQMKAEMTALRALNYFYLLRAFKDIPYSTQVINKDTEVQYFGATNQLVVLDSLILDLENVQGTARTRFTQLTDTKGLITNSAIYAILSDMYLWRASLHEGRWKQNTDRSTDTVMVTNIVPNSRVRNLTVNGDSVYTIHTVKGDYRLACEYADLALASLAKQNLEERKKDQANQKEMVNYGLTNCDMYKNEFDGFNKGEAPRLHAYDAIFSAGNSQESILELQFSQEASSSNPINSQLWGYGEGVRLCVSNNALTDIYGKNTTEQPRDSRLWFSAWKKDASSLTDYPAPYCFKWCKVKPNMPETKQTVDLQVTIDQSGSTYSNWIVYRLSDMMLIKAEALVALNENGEAMRYVNAVHRRWYCNDDRTNSAQPNEDVTGTGGNLNQCDNASTLGNAPKADSYEKAVMNERFLEFLGEGKRWFDLVRYAERHAGGVNNTKDEREWTEESPVNNGKVGVDLMVDNFLRSTFSDNYTLLKNRFKNRYGLYNIIYYMEIKASVDANGVRHLEQNPVWNKSKYD